MPRVTNSPKQSRSSNKKSSLSRVNSSQGQHYAQNEENFQQGEDQSYHENSRLQSQKKGQSKNISSNRLSKHQPPKYEEHDLISDQSLKKQRKEMSRVRQELIDMRNEKLIRSKDSSSPIKETTQLGQSSKKQVGILSSQIHIQPQNIQEQPEINTPQYEKIRNLHVNMQKLSESLLDLRENYDDLQKQEIKYSNSKGNNRLQQSRVSKLDNLNKSHLYSSTQSHQKSAKERANQNAQQMLNKSKVAPKTKEEILNFLLQKRREKEERRKKLSIITQQTKKKLEQQLEKRQKEEEQYLQWRKNQIRNASNFAEKHKQEKEIEEIRRKAAQEYSKKIKDKKYIYLVKKIQHEENKQKQFQQNREKIVSQRKQLHKPLNLEQIEEHQKWFYAKREELLEEKRLLRRQQMQKIQQLNSNMPEFWKGNAHQVTEEQRKRIKEKLKQPLIKAQKIKQYKEYLHENFVPKSPKLVKQDSKANFDSDKYREIKRYRYYKGISYGEIAQTAPIAKDAKQIKQIGDSNMEIMKKIPKKRRQNTSLQVNSTNLQPQKRFDVNLVRNIFSSVVQKERAKVLKVFLPQNPKCHQLNAVIDKVRSKSLILYDKQKFLNRQGNKNGKKHLQQQELVDSLVNSIELKLSLLAQL